MPALTQNMIVEAGGLLPALLWDHLSDDDGGVDPFIEKLPMSYIDSSFIKFDQLESPYGLMSLSAIDDAPPLFVVPGLRVYEIKPGYYREYTQLLESKLTDSREPGTAFDPLDVAEELGRIMLYMGQRFASRIFQIYAQLGTLGQLNITGPEGLQHTYQIENFRTITATAWLSSPSTATPIDDLRTGASVLNKGTSSRFGGKSFLLMADEGVNALLATAQIRNAFRSEYGASYLAPFDNAQKSGKQPPLNGNRSLNSLFLGMGLPEIIPWNRGYYPKLTDVQNQTYTNFIKFLSPTQGIWLGYRPKDQPIGKMNFTRHAGLIEQGDSGDYGVVDIPETPEMGDAGKGIYFRAHYRNFQPHHYDIEIGANIAPQLYYGDAIAAVNWS